MNTFFSENLSNAEVARRFVLTTVILAFFYASSSIPAWVTLISIYPFATGLLRWDPLNALLEMEIFNRKSVQKSDRVNTGNLQSAM